MLFGNKGLVIAHLTQELQRVNALHDELLKYNVSMFQEYRTKYNLLVEQYNALLNQNKKDQEEYNPLVQKYNALLNQNKKDQEAYLVYTQHAEARDDAMNFNFEKQQKEIVRLGHENKTLKKENENLTQFENENKTLKKENENLTKTMFGGD